MPQACNPGGVDGWVHWSSLALPWHNDCLQVQAVNGTNGMKKIELCDIFNMSNVKYWNTLGGLDQYMCRGLRLWNCRAMKQSR